MDARWPLCPEGWDRRYAEDAELQLAVGALMQAGVWRRLPRPHDRGKVSRCVTGTGRTEAHKRTAVCCRREVVLHVASLGVALTGPCAFCSTDERGTSDVASLGVVMLRYWEWP